MLACWKRDPLLPDSSDSRRTLVPVAGMIIGNSMKAAVVGAARMAESVADHRSEI